MNARSGLTLVELLVVLLVLGLLSAALFPAGTDPWTPSSGSAGVRGKDIFVALTAASAERQALGMRSLWPMDVSEDGNALPPTGGEPVFTNSTDYFAWLIGAKDGSVERWDPRDREIDAFKLSGAGVATCPRDQRLTAEHNMWTVAKNVRSDMPDYLPVLVTRNIDASTLASRVEEDDWEKKSLRFDPAWELPFKKRGFVMIRKGGAIFKARSKYMSWGKVYQRQSFDEGRGSAGQKALPLKYLTPDGEVTPAR